MADERGRDRRDQEPEFWLGELLDRTAEEYEPDAERLSGLVAARIAQSSDEDAASVVSGRLGRLGAAGIPVGVALATIGTAAVIAVGATATIAVTSTHDHHPVTVAAPSTRPGTGAGAGSAVSQSPETSASASASASPVTTTAASTGLATSGASTTSEPVSVHATIGRGTGVNWAELDVAVTVKRPLTALHITIKVAKCDGLASAGTWNSGAGGQFTEVTTTDSGGSITYDFELAAGQRVNPETLTFAAQFTHAPDGWTSADDTYSVSAGTATSTGVTSASGSY